LGRIGSLGLELSRDSRALVLCEETLQNAAIEGQILNREAVRSSVARRLGLPAAAKAVDRNADGLVQVLWDATEHYAQPLTAERLWGWQAALFPTGYSGLHKIRVGAWRTEPMRVLSGPVGREKVHYEAPPAAGLASEMTRFLDWWGKAARFPDGLLRAGLAHFYFVTLHPFEDGNGRLARALTDMALSQDEKQAKRYYSLSAQIMAEREDYYDILEETQKGDLDVTAWLEWFLGCYRRALKHSEKTIARVLDKALFWQTHAAATLSPRQRKAVNRLLDEPEGFSAGLTTRHYVGLTKASRATAYREITDLVEKGLLKHHAGKGRNVRYALATPRTRI
jgi:Fic family protein